MYYALALCAIIIIAAMLVFEKKIVGKIIAWKILSEEKFFFHHDLGNKIILELEDDDTISKEEWDEWLKISIFADERFNQKSVKQVESEGLEEIVRAIIEEKKET